MRIPAYPPDLQIELRRFPADEIRLRRPLPAIWQTPIDFGLPGTMNDGRFVFAGDPPGPCETGFADLWLLVPECNAGRLYEGFVFRPWPVETIGEGIVRRVVNPLLRFGADAIDVYRTD